MARAIDKITTYSRNPISDGLQILGASAISAVVALNVFNHLQAEDAPELVVFLETSMAVSVMEASGAEKGLGMVGISIDQVTASRLEELRNIIPSGIASQAYEDGLQSALAGAWSPSRLKDYVEAIDSFERNVLTPVAGMSQVQMLAFSDTIEARGLQPLPFDGPLEMPFPLSSLPVDIQVSIAEEVFPFWRQCISVQSPGSP